MEYKRVKKYFDKKVGQILMYPINFIVSNFIEGERSDAYGEDRA
ncbi:hypothetical protein PVOR_08590 [Paenibacillus vortex V453]|uniref:Uncharacterized protein n=1 Tax=Paenibacillus vortex V453 TaxID=715225 RepID=A0A2R9SY35_9BACL|nr:hypothetical protein PVOR_08590 [Paenibacillus vortex V453]